MTRVTFEGHTLDARTRDMVVGLRYVTRAPVVITQGSYNTSVSASAGTHSGGGAVDISVRDLTSAQEKEIETNARHIGFATWIREAISGVWPRHIHMIAIGCPDLAPAAARQVTAYFNGRNGLANNGPDTGTRAYVNWTWEKAIKEFVVLLDSATIANIAAAVTAKMSPVVQAYSGWNARNLTQQLVTLLANFEDLEQKYANAVNNYTRQDGDISDDAILTAIAGLKGQLVTLQAEVDALQAAEVEDHPKA